MGIGINFDKDDDFDDGPLFGRHWLEDSEYTITKEDILIQISILSKEDKEWLKNQLKIKEK